MKLDAFGRYQPMRVISSTQYYNLATTTSKVQLFPDNFGLVTGNASNFGGSGPTMGGYLYVNTSGANEDVGALPQTYSSYIGVHLTFPDCWTGKPFTSATQNQEMSFSDPTTYDCRAGLIKLPQVMLSVGFDSSFTSKLTISIGKL